MFGETLPGVCRRLLIVGLMTGMAWVAVAPAQAGPDDCCEGCQGEVDRCILHCLSFRERAECEWLCEQQRHICSSQCIPRQVCPIGP